MTLKRNGQNLIGVLFENYFLKQRQTMYLRVLNDKFLFGGKQYITVIEI